MNGAPTRLSTTLKLTFRLKDGESPEDARNRNISNQQEFQERNLSNEKSTGKQNTQENNNRRATFQEKILLEVSPIYLLTTIFENSQRQWNNNVRFGAAPISSAYIRMVNQEVPEL